MDNMENRTTASEIIAEQESRLKAVLYELEATVLDSLEKCNFALGNLLGLTVDEIQTKEAALEYAVNYQHLTMYTNIAIDYLAQAIRTIEDIIQRERKQEDGEDEND